MANHFLRRQANWEELYFYKKTDVLYQLTFAFTKRFLKMGDRTIDQMVQAARSGKQNIAEGCADGVSSTEMEIKLINVARASIKELKEDYEDYLTTRNLCKWDDQHPRFAPMLDFCRQHNNQADYSPMYYKASDEELANIALTLCRQVDKMMTTYLEQLEKTFIEEGGIKERMTAARLGRRQTQNETIEAQAHEIEQLKERVKQLEEERCDTKARAESRIFYPKKQRYCMKQKILYILLIITALLGGNGEAWAQDGYVLREINNISFTRSEKELSNITNNLMTISNTTNSDNYDITIIFTFGQSDILYQNSAGLHLTIRGKETNEFKWSVPDYCAINITYFKANVTSSFGGKMEFVSSGGQAKTQSVGWSSNNVELTGMNLDKNGKITLSTNNNSYDYYIHNLTFTYNISYYKLDVSSLESAITNASKALELITDETIKGYLETAITNANSFKEECAFPNSYWNASSVGKIPAEVKTTAEKLNAITNYLIARTNANQFKQSMVPNAVYDWLHTYDQYNPNDFDASTINTATNDINAAISAANATTSAYQSALTTIDTAKKSFDKTDDQGKGTLTADITKAEYLLELATDVNGINTALANIKGFDTITFNAESEIEEEATLPNPASAKSGKVITYESSDNTIIEIDGTTLKALKPGTVTITAKTTTGDGYYGYTTTKEFTVTPKAVILNPVNECTVVPNIVYPEITLSRTFVVGHSTLALPFDTNISDFSDDSEAYAAQLSLVTYNKADGYTLYFKKVDEGKMIANQPYVVNLPSTKESFTWTNVTIDSVDPLEKVEGENESFQGWKMRANYTPGVSMLGKYGIADGKLCIGGAESIINAYTAYFILPTPNARVRMAVLDDDGGVTYIDDVRADGDAIDEAEQIYRLDGTRHATLTKGINIVKMANGEVRKVLK